MRLPGSTSGCYSPTSLWQDDVLHLPKHLSDAHGQYLRDNGWFASYAPRNSASIGGLSAIEAQDHVVNRFLNSAARMQFVCADPRDEHVEIRAAVLDQLAEGTLHVIDLAAGNGAGTLGLLSLICELRVNHLVPRLPVNVVVSAIDYSAPALNHFASILANLKPWLDSVGIRVELSLLACDLTLLGDFSETLEGVLAEARAHGTNRFLCVISALTGAKKEGMEPMIDALKQAAATLSHSKRVSTWLWVEPPVGKSWFTALVGAIRLTLGRVRHTLLSSGETLFLKSEAPVHSDPKQRAFRWHDPHNGTEARSNVIVLSFRNA